MILGIIIGVSGTILFLCVICIIAYKNKIAEGRVGIHENEKREIILNKMLK